VAYKIKVTIMNTEPPVWRRLRIPGSITFSQLHRIIQVAFGWLDYHLFRFEFEDAIVVEGDPDFPVSEIYPGKRFFEPDETLVNELLSEGGNCIYIYDFGDHWQHKIVIEKSLKESKRNAVPLCLGGAMHRPPEDVGGIGGYGHFLEVISDRNDPERQEFLAWAEKDTKGRLFDPEYFWANEVNEKLRYVLEDTPEAAKDLLLAPGGLVGLLKFGWTEPYIDVKGKRYTWERIGNLLYYLDEDDIVTLQVLPGKRRKEWGRHM